MRKNYEQMSLLDTYKSVEERLENNKPELFQLLDEHLDWEEIIPARFYSAFYRRLGRKCGYLWAGEFPSGTIGLPAAQHTAL